MKPSEVLNDLAYDIYFYLALIVIFIVLIVILYKVIENRYF